MSRGFLPVVALQESPSSHSSPDRGHSPSKGHGKKGGKGKSKSKGKGAGHAGKKGVDPRGRAKAAMASACLRCGSTAHSTAQCNQTATPKPNSSGNKRQAVESVANAEHGLVIFEDRDGHERPDCAMLDPGASSFLMGYGPFLRYVELLRNLHFPVESIVLKKADRAFFFGGDHQAKSSWTVHLPVFIKGTFGLIQGFLLQGETPMLLGRPVASELGLCVDFREHTMRYHPDTSWRPCLLGKHGEYLVPLTEDFEEALIDLPATFDLVMEEESGPDHPLQDFMSAENVFVATELDDAVGMVEDESVPLPAKTVKTLSNAVNCRINEMHAYVHRELRRAREVQPRVIWEVYTGESRVAQIAESLGAKTLSFGLRTGWNFDLKTDQRKFLELVDKDEIFLAPTRSPWSKMQNISASRLCLVRFSLTGSTRPSCTSASRTPCIVALRPARLFYRPTSMRSFGAPCYADMLATTSASYVDSCATTGAIVVRAIWSRSGGEALHGCSWSRTRQGRQAEHLLDLAQDAVDTLCTTSCASGLPADREDGHRQPGHCEKGGQWFEVPWSAQQAGYRRRGRGRAGDG